MNGRTIIVVLLTVVASLTGWSLWQKRLKDQGQTVPTGRADYVLQDFELVALNEQGQESFTLRAPRLARDPNAKTMDITTPLFLIPPRAGSQGEPWEVRSKTGWVSAKGEELRLRGDVKADSQTVDGKTIQMRSEQLNVFPRDRRATSSSAVTLTQPGLILNGRGLEVDLDAKRALLKSNVKGRYESFSR